MFLMHWGLLNKPIFDPPYVGIFLEGFLTNGDWRTIIVCAIQLVAAVAIYWPFFKIMEKQDEVEAQKQNNKDIFTKEEENLLRRKRFIKRKRDFGFKFYKQAV